MSFPGGGMQYASGFAKRHAFEALPSQYIDVVDIDGGGKDIYGT